MSAYRIAFADVKDSEGVSVHFVVSAYSGYEIDHSDRAGQVSLNISGYDGESLLYDTVVDLELPLARVFAAAVLEMVSWVEAQDRMNRPKRSRPK